MVATTSQRVLPSLLYMCSRAAGNREMALGNKSIKFGRLSVLSVAAAAETCSNIVAVSEKERTGADSLYLIPLQRTTTSSQALADSSPLCSRGRCKTQLEPEESGGSGPILVFAIVCGVE